MKLNFKFAEDLRALMLATGISQKELANISGLTEASISNYLNGKRSPNAKSIDAINKAIGSNFCLEDYDYKLNELEKKFPHIHDAIRYQKLMSDGKFDILEKIIEIEKEIDALKEEKRKLLESA